MRFDWVLPLAVHCLFKTHLPASIAFSEKENVSLKEGAGSWLLLGNPSLNSAIVKKKLIKNPTKQKTKSTMPIGSFHNTSKKHT